MRIPLSTLGRWRRRKKESHRLVNPPGPKKVEPFDPSALDADIRLLDHGPKRSGGTTELYGRYQDRISRRELSRMVWQVRQEVAVDHRNHLRQIDWLVPGVVWAMDITEYEVEGVGTIHLPLSVNHPVAVYAEVAAHDLNHRLRPCLNGKTSCQVFFSLAERSGFSKLERREIYDIVLARVERILMSINQFGKSAREAAWRIAVEFWLQSRGFIKVHIPKKVSPNFTPIFDS